MHIYIERTNSLNCFFHRRIRRWNIILWQQTNEKYIENKNNESNNRINDIHLGDANRYKYVDTRVSLISKSQDIL